MGLYSSLITVSIDSFRRAFHSKTILKEIFNQREIGALSLSKRVYESLAAKFAIKKAINTLLNNRGLPCLSFTKIEVKKRIGGAPYIYIQSSNPKLKKFSKRLKISISHSKNTAAAIAAANFNEN